MTQRILIVEDHADIRRLIRMTLEFESHEIHEAVNADEGLEAVRRLRPQLLLLDIMMPGQMDGLDLCRLVKSDPSLGMPQVILLTARTSLTPPAAATQADARSSCGTTPTAVTAALRCSPARGVTSSLPGGM